jgi:hypothetical protein
MRSLVYPHIRYTDLDDLICKKYNSGFTNLALYQHSNHEPQTNYNLLSINQLQSRNLLRSDR